MSLVGYPDFQEQAQWQSPPAVVYSAAIANGATKTFPVGGNNLFNVSNWANTQMRIFGQVAALDVECQWYDADPPTALLGHRYFTTCGNGSDSNVNLPNCGPYLRVNVTNLSGFAPTLVAVIAFSNRVSAPFVCPSSGPMIDANNGAVGAGALVTFDAAYLYAGMTTVSFFTSATTWSADVIGSTSDGTFSTAILWQNGDGLGGQMRLANVIVPPRWTRARFLNSDGVARPVRFVVTPDLFR